MARKPIGKNNQPLQTFTVLLRQAGDTDLVRVQTLLMINNNKTFI